MAVWAKRSGPISPANSPKRCWSHMVRLGALVSRIWLFILLVAERTHTRGDLTLPLVLYTWHKTNNTEYCNKEWFHASLYGVKEEFFKGSRCIFSLEQHFEHHMLPRLKMLHASPSFLHPHIWAIVNVFPSLLRCIVFISSWTCICDAKVCAFFFS